MEGRRDVINLIVAFRNSAKALKKLSNAILTGRTYTEIQKNVLVNLLDPELFFLVLAHPVYKM